VGVAYDDKGTVVSGMGGDAADYNNDGYPDVFYNNLSVPDLGLVSRTKAEALLYSSPATGVARLSRASLGWSNAFVD